MHFLLIKYVSCDFLEKYSEYYLNNFIATVFVRCFYVWVVRLTNTYWGSYEGIHCGNILHLPLHPRQKIQLYCWRENPHSRSVCYAPFVCINISFRVTMAVSPKRNETTRWECLKKIKILCIG